MILPSSGHTGYQWLLENDAAAILQLKQKITQKAEDPANILHREETIWHFQSIATGESNLSFVYQLAWDSDVADKQRFQCALKVDER